MPGTRIRRSLGKFAEYEESTYHRHVKVFSLEEVFQTKAQPLVAEHFAVRAVTPSQTFLLPRSELRRLWKEAWNEILAGADHALETSDVIVTFHLSWFHQLTREYFVAVDMPSLLQALPERTSRVVTLVDDIYDCHESLIAGGSAAGMMSSVDSIGTAILDLLQVLDWRSIEVMLSESLAASIGVPHVILAVKHPLETFHDLLFTDKRIVYFSHPISEPRRMHAAGRTADAEAFVQRIAQIVERLQADSVVIEPTTIDELRFAGVSGNLALRWPFHPDTRQLLYEAPTPAPPGSRPHLFPSAWAADTREEIGENGLVQSLRKAVQEQIDARDHGLVEQSRVIGCYRPIYDGNASRGVREELEHFERLVALGLRKAEASVVFSPDEDRAKYPRRQLAEQIIPQWERQHIIEGPADALHRFRDRVLSENSAQIENLIQGDHDALLTTVADCNLTIRPDDQILPGGALGAGENVRRQAMAAELAEQARRAGTLYLDGLQESGIIQIVSSEQLFYDALGIQIV